MSPLATLFRKKSTPHTEVMEKTVIKHFVAKKNNYTPGLIENLKDDHRQLLRIFAEVRNAATSGNFQYVVPLLNEFKITLRDHATTENVHFYTYAQSNLELSTEVHALISDIRADMSCVIRDFLLFIEKTTAAAPNSSTAERFMNEFDEVSNTLTNMVHTEETRLYTLYPSA